MLVNKDTTFVGEDLLDTVPVQGNQDPSDPTNKETTSFLSRLGDRTTTTQW